MLTRALPRDSATSRALNGDWSQTEELLAGIYDALRSANWQRGGGKGIRPKPYPRPGQPDRDRHWGSARPVEEMREILDNWSRN